MDLNVPLTKPGRPATENLSLTLQWMFFVCAALLVTWMLELARFPSAILLGPMLVGVVFGVRGSSIRLNKRLFQFAQGIAGCLIAQNLTSEILHHALSIWPAVLISASLTLLSAGLVGFLFSRLTVVTDREAIWGFLPGMAGTIIAMAHERGVDARIVAVIQVVRLVAVILAMSLLSRLMVDGPASIKGSEGVWLPLLTTLGVALTGPIASRFLPYISAAATMVPMILGATLQASGLVDFHVPYWLLLVSYLLIGADVGLKFTPTILRDVLHFILPLGVAVVCLLVACGAIGAFLAWLLSVDMLTAILATVPGSIDSVAIIAINSGADVSFVITIQVVRLFAVLLIGPYVVSVICSNFPKRLNEGL
jgi:membrane AbrB-like protein